MHASLMDGWWPLQTEEATEETGAPAAIITVIAVISAIAAVRLRKRRFHELSVLVEYLQLCTSQTSA